MHALRLSSKTLKGLSFSPAELILVRGWSEASSLRMVIRLDHGSDAEDYEEVLAFHIGDSPLCRWIMWRDTSGVFVQPIIGRIQHYGSVAEAFEGLTAKQSIVLTDIKPSRWPA